MTIDSGAIGPTAAAYRLFLCGFTPHQAERLVSLRLRRDRGEFDELTDEARRALFVRWLVQHGHLTEWPAPEDSRRHGRVS